MLTQTQHNGFRQSVHRRRYSHLDKLEEYKQSNQREQLKNKYKQILKSRKKSSEDYPFSPQSNSIGRSNDMGFSMPSIRTIIQQKRLISETLRQTITRYNYIRHEKQKKLQNLNRKKMKFERVMSIREEHLRQKTQMNQSRLSFIRQITQQKLKLKKMVDSDKMSADLSKSRVMSQKKQLGNTRRLQQINNKSRIKTNRLKQFQSCKKLHEGILLDQKKLKIKKQLMQKRQKKINTQNYKQKLLKYLQSFAEVEQKQTKTKLQLSPKMSQMQNSTDQLDQKLRNYEIILKDGSTLKKPKPAIKLLKIKQSKTDKGKQFQMRVKTTSESSQSFY